MRADAHYVDQLDAPRGMTVQMIAVGEIDGVDDNASPILSLVDSIRRHGVLEPLLVQARDRRYRLLAGKRRLAAAISAGLHQVPCIPHRVSDDEARMLAAAASLSVPSGSEVKTSSLVGIDGDLANSLSAVVSCTALLSDATPRLTRTMSVGLIQAELRRAICILHATRVLRHGVPVEQQAVSPREVVRRVSEALTADSRLSGVGVDASINLADGAMVRADEELLVQGLIGVGLMLSADVANINGARLTLSAASEPGDRLVISITQNSVVVPQAWPFLPSHAGVDGPAGPTPILARRQVAEAYGGQLSAARLPLGSRVLVELPLHRQRW